MRIINAKTKTGEYVPNDIIVDTTLICGKEGVCPINTYGSLIYVGKLDKSSSPWRTVGVNSSKNTDMKIANLRAFGVEILTLILICQE